MKLIDPHHSFYRPLWIRVLIVAVCFGWAIVEATVGEPFWGMIVGAAGIYAAWMLLLSYNPNPPAAAPGPSAADDGDDKDAD